MKHATLIVGALLLAGSTAGAQGGRMAGMPSPSPSPAPTQVPVIVLNDGSVIADFGRGYERLIRACSAYSRGDWPGGQPRGVVVDRPPQGGSASRAPGANGLPTAPGASGLPAAPGMSAPPGAQGRTVGTSSVGQTSVGRSSVGMSRSSGSAVGTSTGSLQSTHSGWRSAGPAYYDGACYAHDTRGRLRLIYR